MNTKTIVVSLVALVIIGGGYAVYTSQMKANEEMAMQKEKTAQMEKEAVMKSEAMEKEAMMKVDAEADLMMQKDVSAGSDSMMKKDEGTTMAHTGSYETYGAEKIAMASASHDVVLFFHASWCPTCRALDTDIKAHLGDIPSNLTILDVDYDDSAELKKKYGVTYEHTFVQVDAQGNMLKKWSGSPTLAKLVAEVK